VARTLLAHLAPRQPAQFLMHCGNQLIEGLVIAVSPGKQQIGDLLLTRRVGRWSAAHHDRCHEFYTSRLAVTLSKFFFPGVAVYDGISRL
jgi:hypothetical protein